METMKQTAPALPADVKAEKNTLARFNASIASPEMSSYLASVLGSRKESFISNIISLVANDVKLQSCTPMSLIYAGIKATAIGLSIDPNLGQAYVIPYNTTSRYTDKATGEQRTAVRCVAQFQMGYKGFYQLALRSGLFRTINVTDIRAGEIDGFDLLTGEVSLRRVGNRETLPVIGYAAYFALTGGFSKSLFMTSEEIRAHALKYSQTYKSKNEKVRDGSRWSTDFETMARKTVLKLLLSRYAPLSTDLRAAVEADQCTFGDRGEMTYPDAPAAVPSAAAPAVEERKENMRENGSASVTEDLP